MGVRENKIEKYLDSEIKKLGGFTRKWVSPGRDGVPDRIVFVRGRIYFVEVKTDSGKLTLRQEREIALLNSHGMNALVVYGRHGVNKFIDQVCHDVG